MNKTFLLQFCRWIIIFSDFATFSFFQLVELSMKIEIFQMLYMLRCQKMKISSTEITSIMYQMSICNPTKFVTIQWNHKISFICDAMSSGKCSNWETNFFIISRRAFRVLSCSSAMKKSEKLPLQSENPFHFNMHTTQLYRVSSSWGAELTIICNN